MIKNIQGIKYDGGPAGQAFGGGIYSATCNIGFSNQPTKITLNIVSENSKYTVPIMDVTSSGAHTITIGGIEPVAGGDPVGAVNFKRMYIYSYTYNNSPTSKTLTVNFVDHSIMLDKIFVGLIGRHGTTSFVSGADDGGMYNPANAQQLTAMTMTYGFRLLCLECNEMRPSKQLRPPSWLQPYFITRMVHIAGDGLGCPQPLKTYINVGQAEESVNGGYMLLGVEQFKDTECEIPKVTYTFDDLCNGLDWILGADPHGCNGQASYRHNLRNFKRSSTYENNYTGTLREVLSSWAADFSFDFTFDYELDYPYVFGIDLKEPIDLTDVKTAIGVGFGPDSGHATSGGGLVRSHTEVHTLENTYYQTPLVKYIKPPRPFQRQKTHYESMPGKVLTPQEALYDSANLGRDEDELYVSMALAKYSPEARLIWLSDLAARKNEGEDGPHGDGTHKPKWPAANAGDWCNPLHLKDFRGAGGCPANSQTCHGEYCAAHNLPSPCDCPQAGWDDLQYNTNVHGWCIAKDDGPQLGKGAHIIDRATKLDCESIKPFGTWITSADDTRLRRDSPWPALGFFPALSWNNKFNLDATLDVHLPANDNNWNPEVEKKYTRNRVFNKAAALQSCPAPCPHYHKVNRVPLQHQDARWKVSDEVLNLCKGTHPIYCYPNRFSLYLGIWNEEYQDKVGDFDKELADNFLGQYGYWFGNRTSDIEVAQGIFNYGPMNPPPNERHCPKFHFDLAGNQEHATYLYQHKVSTLPASKIYSGHSYPFDNILRANGGFFAVPFGQIDTQPYCTYCPERSIFKIDDNKWGTPPDQISNMLKNKYIVAKGENDRISFVDMNPNVISDLGIYIPKYSRLDPVKQAGYFNNIVGVQNWTQTIVKPEYMKSGYWPGLAVIPKMEYMNVGVSDGQGGEIQYPVLSVDYDHWRCTKAQTQDPNHWCNGQQPGTFNVSQLYFSSLVQQNWTRRRNESLIGPPSECVLYCEEDIQRELCACPEIDEPIHGFLDYDTRWLGITHVEKSAVILYPIEHWYTGFWLSEQMEKGTIMKKQIVMGEPPTPEALQSRNVMGTRIVDVDATPDLDALEATTQGKFETQLTVTNTHVDPPQAEVVTLPQYYTFMLGLEQSNSEPGEQVDVKLDGTEFDTLKTANVNYLSPAYGLSTFNISLDDSGISTSLSFRTRPAKLPKRDVLLQKLGPRALEGRMYKPGIPAPEPRDVQSA